MEVKKLHYKTWDLNLRKIFIFRDDPEGDGNSRWNLVLTGGLIRMTLSIERAIYKILFRNLNWITYMKTAAIVCRTRRL